MIVWIRLVWVSALAITVCHIDGCIMRCYRIVVYAVCSCKLRAMFRSVTALQYVHNSKLSISFLTSIATHVIRSMVEEMFGCKDSSLKLRFNYDKHMNKLWHVMCLLGRTNTFRRQNDKHSWCWMSYSRRNIIDLLDWKPSFHWWNYWFITICNLLITFYRRCTIFIDIVYFTSIRTICDIIK